MNTGYFVFVFPISICTVKSVLECLYFVFSIVNVLDEVKNEVEDIFWTEVLDISE